MPLRTCLLYRGWGRAPEKKVPGPIGEWLISLPATVLADRSRKLGEHGYQIISTVAYFCNINGTTN